MALEKTIRIKVDSSGAKKSIDGVDRSLDNLDSTAQKTTNSMGNLKTSVIAVAAALQVGVIVKYADAFTSIQNIIRQTTKSTGELTARTSELLAVANRSRTDFSATAGLYQQLTLSTENLNLSTEKQIRLTETITKSFAVGGKTTAEAAGAITQLGQAFSAGALRGDEFNSIADGAPEIMRALQRSLGKTQGELRAFAATGGITAEILVNALDKAADVIDRKLSASTVTLAQSFQIAENNAISFVGASDLVTTSMGIAGRSVVAISENLDVLANAALVGVWLGFGRLTASIILNTIETVKNTIAKLENVKVTQGVIVGTNGATLSTIRHANAMNFSTLAARGLSGAMGLLGGPLGVVTLAVSALAFFVLTADDAADKARKLDSDVDKMASTFGKLNDEQLRVKLVNATQAAFDLEIATNNAEIAMKRLQSRAGQRGVSGGDIVAAEREFAKLNERLQKAVILRDALSKAGIDKGGFKDGTEGGKKDKPQTKKDVTFLSREQNKTSILKSQLAERIEVQRAFNSLMLTEFKSVADEERAIADFNEAAELARLQSKREKSIIDFDARREQAILQGQNTFDFQLELQAQELAQAQIFEIDKNEITQAASEERIQIAKNEARTKRELAFTFANQFLAIDAAFGSKSEKANKSRQKRQARINGAAGIVRAWADLPFYAAIGATVAIAASTEAQIRKMDGAGSSSGGNSSSIGRSISEQPAPQRQQPINQTQSIEFRGLSEVADALKNMDRDEQIPVEFAQRIISGISEYERLSGGA